MTESMQKKSKIKKSFFLFLKKETENDHSSVVHIFTKCVLSPTFRCSFTAQFSDLLWQKLALKLVSWG